MSILDEIYDLAPGAQRYSNYLMLFCPWHGGKRRSLMVHDDYFKCLSCDQQGNPEYLLRSLGSYRGIIVPTEIEFTNPWNDWLQNEILAETLERAAQSLKDHPSHQAYWKSRGVKRKIAITLGLGYLDGYATIPIKSRRNRIVGGVARAIDSDAVAKYVTPNRYYQDNNKLLYVPSWKRAHKSDKVYLTFGLISAIAVYMAGFASCSPLTGKKVNPEILKDIRKPIIILPDKLEEKEAMKLANQLGWRGNVQLLPYYDDVLDPADFDTKTLKGYLNGLVISE